jgi:hypothetical protein
MKKAAFTICAKNYIGLAQALETSIKRHHDDIDFYIFVADEFDADADLMTLPSNVLISKNLLDIGHDEWYSMAFKYDLTEFCTAIKPSCFKYIFEKMGAEACLFFDPDIMVYNSLTPVYNYLNSHSVILTPHITTIQETYTGVLKEQNLLYSGMYNLGFVGLRYNDSTIKLLNWWKVRLKDRCFQNKMENYFTDQKWMDFIPSFFPTETLVSPNIGLNLAPWNFYEREVYIEEEVFWVKNRINPSIPSYPLTFVHFSGINYAALLKGEIEQKNLDNFVTPEDLKPLFKLYSSLLNEGSYDKYLNLPYSYNFFDNNVMISAVYRKLFRRLLEDQKADLNPFNSKGSFYRSLKKARLIKDSMVKTDKVWVKDVNNLEGKVLFINRVLKLVYKIVGADRFFLITRLMRLYSKTENHVYLIDESYSKKFNIWN